MSIGIKELINLYSTLHFEISPGVYNFKTVVQYTSEILLERGLVVRPGIMEIEGIYIYPKEYFSPKSWDTGEIFLTENTYTIHHFAASWHSPLDHFHFWVKRRFGPRMARMGSLAFLIFRNPKKNVAALMRRFHSRGF